MVAPMLCPISARRDVSRVAGLVAPVQAAVSMETSSARWARRISSSADCRMLSRIAGGLLMLKISSCSSLPVTFRGPP